MTDNYWCSEYARLWLIISNVVTLRLINRDAATLWLKIIELVRVWLIISNVITL